MNAQTPGQRASGGRKPHPLAGEIRQRWIAATDTGQKQSAKSIFEDLKATFPNDYPELRTVQAHIKKLREKHPVGNEPPKAWEPWGSGVDQLGAETVAYLLQLSMVSLLVCGRPIYETEATWGSRLRVALQGLDLFVQLLFVREYALWGRFGTRWPETERADTQAVVLKWRHPVRQLDELLGLRPWESADRQERPVWWIDPVFYSVSIERAGGTELFRWVWQTIRAEPGRERIGWRDIAAAVQRRRKEGNYEGSPWESPWDLSDALFANKQERKP